VVTVNEVNDAPVITQGSSTSITVTEDVAKSFTLNATDLENDTLTWSISSQGSLGTATASGTGTSKSVTYTPNLNVAGSDSFSVRVSDGDKTDTISVSVTINVANDAPTISNIANQTIGEGNTTGDIAFTVNDVDNANIILEMTGASGNTTLIPNSSIVFGGGGGNRTVRVYPAANQSGSATITVTVTDGALTASDSFVVTVNEVNDAPVITQGSAISMTVTEDVAKSFTLNATDIEDDTLTWSIKTPATKGVAQVPIGTATSKTITYTPNLNETGSDTFVVQVTDGADTDSITVSVTIDPVNDKPTISDIADIFLNEGEDTGDIAITIGDVETSANDLSFSAISDTSLLPSTYFVYGGSGENRTLKITPLVNGSGSGTVTVWVNDGDTNNFVSSIFFVTINGACASCQRRSRSESEYRRCSHSIRQWDRL